MKKRLYLLIAAIFCFFIIASVNASAQEITTVAGVGTEGLTGDNGPARSAALDWPTSVALDRTGNIYIADANNNIIRKVSNGIITTVAGNGDRAGTGYGSFSGDGGPATNAGLFFPSGIAVDSIGNLFIADQGNNCIREVDTAGVISTIAGIGGAGNAGYMGDGGAAVSALLNTPTRVALDRKHNIYIADSHNGVVREVSSVSSNISTIAGTGVPGYGGDGGPASVAQLSMLRDIALDTNGVLYIADTYNSRIRRVDTYGVINTIAGTGISGYSGDGGPALAADLFTPSGIALDDSGSVYFSDLGNSSVRRLDSTDTITTVAGIDTAGFNGDGRLATTAKLWYPEGLAAVGHNLYIADRGNFRIRELLPSTLAVKNVSNATASIALYPNPGHGQCTIAIYTPFTEPAQIIITNLTGQQITTIDTPTNTPLSINLNQPPGLYFVSAVTVHWVLNEKLIIN